MGHHSLERHGLEPWKPKPFTRGRPLKVRSDREPILIGPIPKVRLNLPDDPDTQRRQQQHQETRSREKTQSVAERTRVSPAETEAKGEPLMQRTRTTVSVPVTVTAEPISQTTTTSPARALVERKGNEAGEDSQPVQMRRITALMAECEDTTTSDTVAEARQKHLE